MSLMIYKDGVLASDQRVVNGITKRYLGKKLHLSKSCKTAITIIGDFVTSKEGITLAGRIEDLVLNESEELCSLSIKEIIGSKDISFISVTRINKNDYTVCVYKHEDNYLVVTDKNATISMGTGLLPMRVAVKIIKGRNTKELWKKRFKFTHDHDNYVSEEFDIVFIKDLYWNGGKK